VTTTILHAYQCIVSPIRYFCWYMRAVLLLLFDAGARIVMMRPCRLQSLPACCTKTVPAERL